MSKKILVATGLFPPQVGGPATYSKLLLEKLPALGYKVDVQSFGWVVKYPKGISHLLYFFRLLKGAIGASVVYAQDPVSVGLPALLVSKILRKSFYLKIVGDYAWEQGSQRSGVTDLLDAFSTENDRYPFLVRVLKKTQKFVADGADIIIVPSNYLKTVVSNWGVNPNKVRVIYNAFDAPVLTETQVSLRQRLNFTGPTITTAGRLVPWKGFDTLISLMPRIQQTIPGLKLYIIGDGPDKEHLKEKITEYKVDQSVVLTGKMRQEDLFAYIKASDLFILNTSYEGFSHQILEVLALGTPIITTAVGGNVEIIQNGQNGILTKYNDKEAITTALIELLTDRQRSSMLAQNGKQTISQFTEERMLTELTSILS